MKRVAALATFTQLAPGKQERVMDAALEEFAEWGYHQASLNRVVARAGIPKGSLYQYFPNKEGLFSFIFQQAVARVRQTLTRVKDETQDDHLFLRLEKSLTAGVRFIREHPRIYGLYLKIMFDRHVPFRDELLASVRKFAGEYLGSLLRQAQRRGELRPGLPRGAALFLLDALFDRFLQAVATPPLDQALGLAQAPEAEINRRIKELMGLLRDGLAA